MKDKILHILESKHFLLYILIYTVVAFIFNIIFSMTDSVVYPYFVCLFSVVYCIIGFLCLYFLKNTKNVLLMTFLFPFFHGTLSNKDINTLLALGPAVIMVVGLVLHHIKFKSKLKMTPMIPGAIVFWLGICVGGFGVTQTERCLADYQWYYTLIYVFVSALIIYVMLVLSNDAEMTFIDYSKLLSFSGLFIVIQILLFMIVNAFVGTSSYFDDKMLKLGWGNANTTAIMLLMMIPAAFYLATKLDTLKERIFYHVIAYGMFIGLILTFSRIGCLVGVIEMIVCVIYSIWSSTRKKESLILHGIAAGTFIITVLGVFLVKSEIFWGICEQLSDIELGTFNGRKMFYEQFLLVYQENKIFGVGLIGSFQFVIDPEFTYNFCHSSIFQLMMVSGSFGLCALLYHWIEKYGRLIIKINKEKFILILCFLFPGLYGLVDATYLVPVYMVALLSSYCMVNDIFKD